MGAKSNSEDAHMRLGTEELAQEDKYGLKYNKRAKHLTEKNREYQTVDKENKSWFKLKL